jgi:hypothetical protein
LKQRQCRYANPLSKNAGKLAGLSIWEWLIYKRGEIAKNHVLEKQGHAGKNNVVLASKPHDCLEAYLADADVGNVRFGS